MSARESVYHKYWLLNPKLDQVYSDIFYRKTYIEDTLCVCVCVCVRASEMTSNNIIKFISQLLLAFYKIEVRLCVQMHEWERVYVSLKYWVTEYNARVFGSLIVNEKLWTRLSVRARENDIIPLRHHTFFSSNHTQKKYDITHTKVWPDINFFKKCLSK